MLLCSNQAFWGRDGLLGGQGMVCKKKTEIVKERGGKTTFGKQSSQREDRGRRDDRGKDQMRKTTQQRPAAMTASQWVHFEMGKSKWFITKLRNQRSAIVTWSNCGVRSWAGWLLDTMEFGYSPQRLKPRGAARIGLELRSPIVCVPGVPRNAQKPKITWHVEYQLS